MRTRPCGPVCAAMAASVLRGVFTTSARTVGTPSAVAPLTLSLCNPPCRSLYGGGMHLSTTPDGAPIVGTTTKPINAPFFLCITHEPIRIMHEVTLSAHRETMAGRLSGGQQRLLALALELLGDRRILFLDEPTSGSDSPASLALVTILRRLCKKVKNCREFA